MPRAEKTTKELKKDLDRITEKYERLKRITAGSRMSCASISVTSRIWRGSMMFYRKQRINPALSYHRARKAPLQRYRLFRRRKRLQRNRLYRQTGRMKEMTKVGAFRVYRSRLDLSMGGALMEPNALCLAPTRSRGSALSKLPKSHFGIP